MAARGGAQEEEENHRNPFLCAINSKPSSSDVQTRKEESLVRWDEELGMGEVVEKKGSMWTTTGIVRDGKLYCHIEEIGFLAEKGELLLIDSDETTLSMRDIYIKIASETYGCSWESFEAYKYLKSLGYIVGRHGTLWSWKNCYSSICHSNLRDDKEEEQISASLKDMQIKELKSSFDVYLPNSRFRISSHGDPNFVLCVLCGLRRSSPPSRIEAENLQRKCGKIPLKFCFVHHGRAVLKRIKFDVKKIYVPNSLMAELKSWHLKNIV